MDEKLYIVDVDFPDNEWTRVEVREVSEEDALLSVLESRPNAIGARIVKEET